MNEYDEEKLFKDLKSDVDGTKISELECLYKDDIDHHRLYVKKTETGFYAHAVEFCCVNEGDVYMWEDDSLIVSTVFECIAYSDGVRHLEFNEHGYLYYPSMQALIEMLQAVRNLELEWCKDYE